jgi:NAD+ synthase (glutamine-hydrolysing)
MKIQLAQQNYLIGDFDGNTKKIVLAIQEAKQNEVDLIVFSELSVCGYPPRDFLLFNDFIEKCEQAIEKIAAESIGLGVLVGAPSRNPSSKGKALYNSVYFLSDGVVQKVIHKTCLPTYDVFDENRYFEAANQWEVIQYKNKKIAVTICEDIWNVGEHPLYTICPMDELINQQPDLMINLSASPFDYTHQEDRKAIIKANVLKYGLPLFYCNGVGSQTEIVFDGHSLVFDKNASIKGMLSAFEEDSACFILNDDGSVDGDIHIDNKQIPDHLFEPLHLLPSNNIASIYSALVMGVKDYFSKMGFSKAILGSSGGIDSAVTLAIAVAALGKENVTAILMPSKFSSSHSVEDANLLSKNLGNPHQIISIESINHQMLNELNPLFKDTVFGVAEENIQSRIRGNLLMAIANKFGYVLLNTSNKSELATGYGTLYGDMAGGIGVLGDCYKMQVYELAKYINEKQEMIPQSIITKAPSAELRPDQKDSDSLPPYEILDEILYQYIERMQGPSEIKKGNQGNEWVDKILNMVNKNEYKRNQFCPIIRISSKAFGVGRRLPIVAQYLQ